MKKAILIQSRLSSSRFPKKMVAKISDLTLVEYVYNRCKSSQKADIVAIITSSESSDDELYDLCIKKEIPVFRGSLNNVLERYVNAGEHYKSDLICRVSGDSPFVDIESIDKMFTIMESEALDYMIVENCLNGFISEVINLNTLKSISNITNDKEDLEHVTRYIRNNLVKFNTKLIDSNLKPKELDYITLTVDYREDLELVKKIIKNLEDFNFTSNDIINILRKKIK